MTEFVVADVAFLRQLILLYISHKRPKANETFGAKLPIVCDTE